MKKIIFVFILLIEAIFAQSQSVTITVAGACGMCQDRIEEAALATIGVTSASYDLDIQKLTVTYSEAMFSIDELHRNIAMAGHDTDKAKTPQSVYDNLPACCAYRVINENGMSGMIFENSGKKKSPLIGAAVAWLGEGTGTITDLEGGFNLPLATNTNKLVVSYIGYRTDTIEVLEPGFMEITLLDANVLKTVEIVYRKSSTEISMIDPIKTKQISRKELTKAACCNLSESFETNPSVDVAYSDAITGTRQIQMLGLDGPYVQITREGIPDIRGLAALEGFTYTPGPWVDGIQMNLGTGSVINGFESVAGQINVELKKPHDEELVNINGYANLMGRYEGNVFANFGVGSKLRSAVSLHYNSRKSHWDVNKDGFLDNPISDAWILSNRWHYDNGNGQEGQFGYKSTTTDRYAGTLHENHNSWGSHAKVNRQEVWLKRGKVFKDRPYMSIGFMLAGLYHDQKINYGTRRYDGNQKMLYSNLLFSTIVGDTDHKITTGFSFQGDQYDETFGESSYARREYVPGVFGEYSYRLFEKFDLVAGIRGDYHNQFGFFVTPRLHTRYAINEHNVLRGIVGRGQRTANIFAENIRGMASNRVWHIDSNNSNTPYGLDAEVAWNYGVNYTYLNEIGVSRPVSFGVDYYFTNFKNQIVVDYDQDPQALHIYNLEGSSYAHSVQFQFDVTPVERLDFRLAYRYNDVKTTYDNVLRWKPLNARHRVFANIAYETKNAWKFDYTINREGEKRLPLTSTNPDPYKNIEISPAYFVSNAQISKIIGKWDIYVGGENIFNFRQKRAIISAEDPTSPYFDASMVWGPIFGSNFYTGFRYTIPQDSDE